MDHNKELYGFPSSVDLKYFASNFQDKQKEARQKEKELVTAAIEKEVLKIKQSPWKIFSGNRNVIPATEMKGIEEEFIDNYYVDLLKLEYLRFHFNTPAEDVSLVPSFSDKSNVLNNCILFVKAAVHAVRNIIQNLQKRCSSFILRAIYASYCWKINSNIQRLVVPLKDTSLLCKRSKFEFPNVYLLKTYSQYDLMFAMLSLFWSDLPTPVVFFNRNTKLWRSSIFENIMFSSIDWGTEEKSCDYERLQTLLERTVMKKRDVLFCLPEDHKEELEVICQILENIVEKSIIPDALLTTVNFSFEVSFENVENTLLSAQNSDSTDQKCNNKFKTNAGLVRAKFGNPFSVKDVVTSYGGDVLQKMIKRLEWELSKSQILMSTSLVSFILLYKFRDGVKLVDLIKEIDRFKNELKYRKKHVGFSGHARNIVNHAIHMLNDKVVMLQTNNEFVIKPVLHLPGVLSLSNLSESVLRYFVLDAAMMTCLAVIFRSNLENIFKCGENLVFNYTELIERIEQLCEILQFEFNFDNPFLPLSSEISEVIFKYIEEEYFVKNEKLMTDEEKWGHRLAKHLESDDDEDYDYRSNRGDTYTVHFDTSGDLYSKIILYKKSLRPILESYKVAIMELKSLINKQIIHSEVLKQIFFKLKNCFENDQLEYPESVSWKYVSNSIKLMEKWNVLESYSIDGIKVCFLSKKYNNEESLYDIEMKVKSFL